MTTPVDPVDPVPQSGDPTPAPGPTPTPDSAPTPEDVRGLIGALSQQISDAVANEGPRKVTVSAIDNSTGTITVNFPAGTNADGSAIPTVDIPGVVYIDSYSPVVGDVVLAERDGSNVYVIGQLNTSNQGNAFNGWLQIGSSNAYVRRVVDNGDLKVQFKGTYTNSGATTLFTLGSGYLPTTPRQVIAASDARIMYNRLQIATNGVVTIINSNPSTDEANGTTSPSSGGSSPGTSSAGVSTGNSTSSSTAGALSGYLSQAGSDLGHGHGMNHTHDAGSHSHSVNNHTHTIGHTHPLGPAPNNVYLDNVEFFI